MNRRIVLLVGAVATGLAGTGAVGAYAQQADARALAGQESVQVLVADRTLPPGSTVEEVRAAVATRTVARALVPAEARKDLEGLGEQVTSTRIAKGQVILSGMFDSTASTTTAPPLAIPAGMLAVSVPVEDPQRAGGFVLPGTEVAVFDTFNAFEGSAPGPKTPSGDGIQDKFEYNRSTRLLLARARVLAVGQAKPGDEASESGSGPAAAGSTVMSVTLAVSQADAERLILAAQTGHIYLALLDETSKTAPSIGVDNRKLFG